MKYNDNKSKQRRGRQLLLYMFSATPADASADETSKTWNDEEKKLQGRERSRRRESLACHDVEELAEVVRADMKLDLTLGFSWAPALSHLLLTRQKS